MEHLIDSEHGASALIAGMVVVLALHLVMKVVEFAYKIFQKKSESTEKTIYEIQFALNRSNQMMDRLHVQLEALERDIVKIDEYKASVDEAFSAIKILAGKRWPEIRKAIKDDVQ